MVQHFVRAASLSGNMGCALGQLLLEPVRGLHSARGQHTTEGTATTAPTHPQGTTLSSTSMHHHKFALSTVATAKGADLLSTWSDAVK